MRNRVIIHDPFVHAWRRFTEPCMTVVAHEPADVIPALQEIEARVESDRLTVAGFVSYEAAPAFDPALKDFPRPGFPLLWFDMYRTCELTDRLQPSPANPGPVPALTPSLSEAAYTQRIQAIKRYIEAGDTYQVNFTSRLTRAHLTETPLPSLPTC